MKDRMTTMKKTQKPNNFRLLMPAVLFAGVLTGGVVLSGPHAHGQDAAGQSAPAQAPEQASGQRTDGQIEMDVVHALDAAPALKDDLITAGTVQGEVTLSGTSASDANRRLAESLAGKVIGVTKVVNNLTVGNPETAQDGQGQPQGQNQDQAQGQYQDQSQPVAQNGDPGPMPQPNGPRPGYNPAPPPAARVPETPHAPVTIAQGTLLRVRTSEPLNSKKAKDGTPVEFTVVRDVYAGGVLAIPRGATVRGVVTESKKAGALGGSPELALKLNALDLEGTSYELDTDPYSVKGPNKAGRTVGNAFGGALLGAIIGGAVGGGGGAAIGAGAGAVGGTAATAATPGPAVWIPAEALMDFHLNSAITVTPVSRQEAQRLAGNAPPPSQRPTLYRRGYYPYGYPPPPPGYYYRPY
jgi:hypothetical protein